MVKYCQNPHKILQIDWEPKQIINSNFHILLALYNIEIICQGMHKLGHSKCPKKVINEQKHLRKLRTKDSQLSKAFIRLNR